MLLEGIQIDHYRLVRHINSGGMGEVYLADDTQLQRQVAIKIIRTDASHYATAREAQNAVRLFLREVQIIAQLDHRHILPLHDAGQTLIQGSRYMYMVMPYRYEGSFADWLDSHEQFPILSPVDVERIIRQAASALQYAHNQQIIHQDVKPSNLLIQGDAEYPGQLVVQLADFGVAKLMGTTSESQIIHGTPIYMAPEQWEGHAFPATDQYALAVMAYELLTGRPPFTSSTNQEMWLQHKAVDPLPPSHLNASLSQDIDEVLLRALAKDPAERFGSIVIFARAFRQAATLAEIRPIEQTLPVVSIDADSQPSHKRARRGIMLKLLLTLLLIAASFSAVYISLIHRPEPAAIIPSSTTSHPGASATAATRSNNNTPTVDANATSTAQSNATATAQADNATAAAATQTAGASANATASAIATATNVAQIHATATATAAAYNELFNRGTLKLDDPLQNDSMKNYQWDNFTTPDSGNCTFPGNAYHSTIPAQGFSPCFAQALTFDNFSYQVRMTIMQGDQGGVIFRADKTNGTFYYFFINKNGSYTLETIDHYNLVAVIHTASDPVINSGLNQTNLLGIIANGNGIAVYVNRKLIYSTTDNTFSQGQIGVICESLAGPTDVAFTDAQVRSL